VGAQEAAKAEKMAAAMVAGLATAAVETGAGLVAGLAAARAEAPAVSSVEAGSAVATGAGSAGEGLSQGLAD